jgi:hypothetical protein
MIVQWWIVKDLKVKDRGIILSYYRRIFLQGLRKTTKNVRIAGLLAEIWTENLPNAMQEF